MQSLHAVLTGDLIKSRSASPDAIEASMSILSETCETYGATHGLKPRFTRSRGDSWQATVPALHAFDLCLACLANLTASEASLATRIAIGLGDITNNGTNDLSDAVGSAFITSGDLLENLSKTRGKRLAIDGKTVTPWQDAILDLTDWIAQDWSQQQAEAVKIYYLEPQLTTNADRATHLSISRQAYEARLKGSGFPALEKARLAFATEYGADHD